MDLLEKLKMVRDEINLLIENEESKKPVQSEVGKKFSERIRDMELKVERPNTQIEKIF